VPLNGELPGTFSPEVVETLERAFEDVSTVLQAHLDPGSNDGKALGIIISRTLVAWQLKA
jgi:hypothetical protein